MVRKTLLSAVLQEYPFLRVVLLLDDPPNPRVGGAPGDRWRVPERLSAELTEWLAEPRERFAATLEQFEMSEVFQLSDEDARSRTPPVDQIRDARRPSTAGRRTGCGCGWTRRSSSTTSTDSSPTRCWGCWPTDFAAGGQCADRGGRRAGAASRDRRMLQLHRRLAWTFRGELTWFERKLYSSLSQESNKAMNLNSYIGLMGHSFDVRQTPEGQVLAPAGNTGSLVIPDADYLLTLDADSIILPEYCLRLVYVMSQPENAQAGRHPDSVLGVPRLADQDGTAVRCDHRPAAHRPPGDELLRRDVLGRRQRGDPQARARRHRRDRTPGRLRDPTVRDGPDGDRGHRVEHRPGDPRLVAAELSRTAELFGDATGLRLAVHPASAVGQRRADHPAEAVDTAARPAQARREQPGDRNPAADQLSRLDLLEQRRHWCCCWCTRSTTGCSARWCCWPRCRTSPRCPRT